jgi:hypothetical protein
MNKYPAAMKPTVTTLFDEATNTVTYIVADPATAKATIVERWRFQPDALTTTVSTLNLDQVRL